MDEQHHSFESFPSIPLDAPVVLERERVIAHHLATQALSSEVFGDAVAGESAPATGHLEQPRRPATTVIVVNRQPLAAREPSRPIEYAPYGKGERTPEAIIMRSFEKRKKLAFRSRAFQNREMMKSIHLYALEVSLDTYE